MNTTIRVVVGIICAILLLPIAIVVVLSFSGDTFLRFPPTSLSLQWYGRFFGSFEWRQSMWASLLIGFVACLIASSVGFLGAYAFVRGRFGGKKFLLSLVLLPIIVPELITAIALYYVSARLGLVGSRLWIAVCHSMAALPIVVMLLMAALQSIDVNLERAAFSLGGGRFTVFRRVVIPLALPGIVSAALFAFLASFDELLIALFLTGVSFQTLPVRIWNSLFLNVEPTIAAVSGFFIGVTILVLIADRAIRHAFGLAASRV